jgi:hypothetical protein
MPFLFWLPMIVFSGLFSVAQENSLAMQKTTIPPR